MTDVTQAPPFSKYEIFAPGFDRTRQLIATQWASIDIDLGAAMPTLDGLMLNIAGNVIYVDPASTGLATLDLNVQQSAAQAPFLAQSGLVLYGVFYGIKVRWVVQAGLILRIFYATDHKVIPATTGAQIITSWTAPQTVNTAIVNTTAVPGSVQNLGGLYGANYRAVSTMAANTGSEVFSAAANANGAIIWRADGMSWCNAFAHFGLIARTVIPTDFVTGDLIGSTDNIFVAGSSHVVCLAIGNPIRVAAGKGLWWLSSQAEVNALRSVSYTLL
jgi:hypothetical protein